MFPYNILLNIKSGITPVKSRDSATLFLFNCRRWDSILNNRRKCNGLLQENLLNILLLFPAGILLPGLTGRKLKWWMGLLVGIAVSSAIEISQLLLCRGLFEFDDIIHNSLGCMLGCLLGNRMLRLVHGK